MCVLWAFIRTSQLSGEFIYCIHGSLPDSRVYIKPVYFLQPLRIIPELSADATLRSAVMHLIFLYISKCNVFCLFMQPLACYGACLLWIKPLCVYSFSDILGYVYIFVYTGCSHGDAQVIVSVWQERWKWCLFVSKTAKTQRRNDI